MSRGAGGCGWRGRRTAPCEALVRFVAGVLALAVSLAASAASAAPADDSAGTARPPAGVEASPMPAGPAIVESDGERYITMDFQDVDIGVLVKFIGEITGKNFVMDERVQG